MTNIPLKDSRPGIYEYEPYDPNRESGSLKVT